MGGNHDHVQLSDPRLVLRSGVRRRGERSDFQAFTNAQKNVVRNILEQIENFTAIDFQEITETSSTHATLRFAGSELTDSEGEDVPAYAYLPSNSQIGGDVWFDRTDGVFNDPALGTYQWFTFIHEIGHSLGLKHGHEDDTADDGFAALPVFGMRLSFQQ